MARILYEKGHAFDGTKLTYDREEPPRGEGKKKLRVCRFKCECGSYLVAILTSVRTGNTRSCGCLRKEATRLKTHGMSKTKAYETWCNMHSRCGYERNTRYKDYGGRGITVCQRWSGENGFINFISDMGEPEIGQTIDRIDVDLGYNPANCRWADRSLQGFNKRLSKKNSSGKTGVKLSHRKNDGTAMYTSQICKDKKQIHLVTTSDFDLAVFCREEAEVHFFGEKVGKIERVDP